MHVSLPCVGFSQAATHDSHYRHDIKKNLCRISTVFFFFFKAKDFIPPMCTIVSINADCPGDCRNSSWDLTAEVTGGFGSNIPSVRVLQGNGKLIITSILNDTGIVTTVVYTSSCCFPELELVAIDEVGNVVTCFKSPSAIAASRILTSGVEFFLVLPFKPLSLWLNMGVSLYQFMQL